MSLSPLRSHKSRHNFIDTPSDICHCNQGVEDTSRFVFFCPSYVTLRATLVTSVNKIILKNNLNRLENRSQLYLHGLDSIIEIYKGHSSFLNLRVSLSCMCGCVGVGVGVGGCVVVLVLVLVYEWWCWCWC